MFTRLFDKIVIKAEAMYQADPKRLGAIFALAIGIPMAILGIALGFILGYFIF